MPPGRITADNVSTFSEGEPQTAEEAALLADIAEGLKNALPCTRCRYCCDGCPMGLDIPMLIHAYNDMRFAGSMTVAMQFDALPDSLLGSGWPTMQADLGVPSSFAGYVSMTISCMTVVSALFSPRLIRRFHTKWIVIASIGMTVLGLLGFSTSGRYWMLFLFAVPYGLGAGSIDAAVNHYVAIHYPSSVMNFLHCFYGLGGVISPAIMSMALRAAKWNQGYQWTSYIQMGILLVCVLSLPLWKQNEGGAGEDDRNGAGIGETLKVPGVLLTLIAFFAYCSGEATCALWTPSYFAGTRSDLSPETVAAFGSLVFGGLMLGRLISGFISDRLGDVRLIRIGIFVEVIGILMVILPIPGYAIAAAGFVIVGIGILPVYLLCFAALNIGLLEIAYRQISS